MPFVTTSPPKRSPQVVEGATSPNRIEGGRVDSFYLTERQMLREQKEAGTRTRVSGIKSFYSWYETDGVVFASVNGLSEASVGQGYHTTIEDDEPEEAKELVDEFGKEMNLDTLLPNICKNMLIAGFCPVDTRINKIPSKSALKIIHPETVKEIVLKKDGSVKYIIQKSQNSGSRDIKIDGKYITLFIHNQIANDPRGTSIIKPVESLLSTKKTAISNIDKIIEKRMFPDIIWKTQRDPAGLKELLAQKEVDEDLVLGWLEEGEMKDVAQIVEIAGNTRYEGYIEHIDRLIYKGLYAPDLYFWKDATLASAKELTTIVDRNVNSIQRNMSRGVEAGFFDRLMTANSLEAEPKVFWGVEKTGAEDLQMENIIGEAIRSGMFSPENLTKLLIIMGLNIGKIGWDMPGEEPPPEFPEDEIPPPEEEEPVEDEALFTRALESLVPELEKVKDFKLSISPDKSTREAHEDLSQFRGPLLTQVERTYRLQGLEDEITQGLVDEEMIPHLTKINAFPFLVTTQSCTGHGKPGGYAHIDFRSSLPIHTTIDAILKPMDEKFSPEISVQLAGLWCDRLRYIVWLNSETWKEQLDYFTGLLGKALEYWKNEEMERLIE